MTRRAISGIPRALALVCTLAVVAGPACGNDSKPSTQKEPPAQPPEQPSTEPPKQVQESLAEIVASCAVVEGTVEIRRRGQDAWEPAAVGSTLREGDQVRTSEHSFARVRFSKRGSIELEQSTTVEIQLAEEGGDGLVVAVKSGSVTGSLDARSDTDQPLWIETAEGERARLQPDAESEEPTEFRVSRRGDDTEVSVRKGRLRVRAGDAESAIGEGQVAKVTATGLGEALSLIAFPTSASPGIDARYRFQDGLRVDLSWKPVDGASGYRVQVARDLSFHSLVTTVETDKTEAVFAPTEAGMYTWRVASLDGDARPGEYGFARRMFAENDPPEDLLVAPPDGHRLAYTKERPQVTFSWQTAGGATSYRLAVARGANPTADPIIDETTSDQSFTTSALGEGRYSWGVYAVGGAETPIFLRPRRLVIEQRKAPKANTKDLWD